MPAGQNKKPHPQGAQRERVRPSKNPAHYPNAPDRHRQAKTTGLVRAANRAGRRQAAPIVSMTTAIHTHYRTPVYTQI